MKLTKIKMCNNNKKNNNKICHEIVPQVPFLEYLIKRSLNVPQGPFGRIKLYFEPEKRPAGASWADQIVFWTRKASQGPLGRITFYYEVESRPAGAFWPDKIVF